MVPLSNRLVDILLWHNTILTQSEQDALLEAIRLARANEEHKESPSR